MEHVNLSAYSNFESIDNFSNENFYSYCEHKLETCNKHIDFIKKHIFSDKEMDVCEIGSGNSKLLYALEKNMLINTGIGIEISESRHKFAEQFKKYIKSTKVQNLNQNVFDVKFDKKYDLFIGVDIVLQLIAPITKNADIDFLKLIFDNLKENGFIILELSSFDDILEQVNLTPIVTNWVEFPIEDPFKYLLSKIYRDQNRDIYWSKKFIKRDDFTEHTNINILRPYTKEEITFLLNKAGFQKVKIFDFWSQENDCDKYEYIILAQR